ncbi:MAG: hypothetical protein HZB16_24165 [Armatimonadetes bacterium]|nr:hypothetical protein [Armatimonadota bacterium]
MRVLTISLALALAGGALAEPGALLEMWQGLDGDGVADLTGSAKYAAGPESLRFLTALDYEDLGNSYGTQVTALVTAPATGAYTFFVASDDSSELYLSTDDQPNTLRRIAQVSGYTDPRTFDQQPGQKSAPIDLTAGRRYLLRVLHKQGGGGNHLAVAWQVPGSTERVILGGALLTRPALTGAQRDLLAKSAQLEAERAKQRAEVEAYMARGETIPAGLTAKLTWCTESLPANDTGINVLVDQSHQTQFVVLWGLRGELRGAGYRACTSDASLGSVLTPGKPCRVRLAVDSLEPFAWWPAAPFNVVITGQQDLKAQTYTPAEQAALEAFIKAGGGVLVFGGRPADQAAADGWSLNQMLGRYGAACTPTAETSPAGRVAALKLSADWEVLAKGQGGAPIRARRAYGKGRIVLAEGNAPFNAGGNDAADVAAAKRALLRETMAWLAAGKPPVGGDGKLPGIGGVGIYPELEKRAGSVLVYYADNQPASVRQLIDRDLERGAKQVAAWFPTKFAAEPYVIVLCAGGGGGWAINPRPKAAAVIEYEPLSILGVFGHEMAHTMTGPANAQGKVCGNIPFGNQGESQAGWFQGKLNALFSGETNQANRNCNTYLEAEQKAGRKQDLATEYETEAARKVFGYGNQWTKMWYAWQKIEDRYGPTWYPRWYWVRSTRWADDPGHRETWDECIETMSIAVGEDLFPFWRSLGTSGLRERCERATFQGQVIELPIAPIDNGPAGNVQLGPIGDYTKPIRPLAR